MPLVKIFGKAAALKRLPDPKQMQQLLMPVFNVPAEVLSVVYSEATHNREENTVHVRGCGFQIVICIMFI